MCGSWLIPMDKMFVVLGVAVCCSVLQCVAAAKTACSQPRPRPMKQVCLVLIDKMFVVLGVAESCSVLQCVAMSCTAKIVCSQPRPRHMKQL